MSPHAPSSTPSSEARSPEDQYKVIRKRNRVPLSCYPCRSRKLKCDRGHPCTNCVKRGVADADACTYANPSSTKRKTSSQNVTAPDEMQNRIDRLEGLVLSLMHGGANVSPKDAAKAGAAAASHSTRNTKATSSTPSTNTHDSYPGDHDDEGEMRDDNANNEDDSDVDDGLATSLGVLKVDAIHGKSMYLGQQHWHMILADIAEVKGYFINHKKDLEQSYEKVLATLPPTAKSGPSLLLGAQPATDIELRAELPPKSTILVLCGRFFSTVDVLKGGVHEPSFYAQLTAHWKNPSKSPIMWLGLLYSIMCIGLLSYDKAGDEPPEWKGRVLDMAAEYRMRTVQCLVTGDFTKPGEYTVETMLLYTFGEFSSRWDADMGLWLTLGLVVRIAYRMGYHRDAKWFPSLTPFQAEMRRRAWAAVKMADVFFSFQVSLPSMIREDDCDTSMPNNLFDEEFGPSSKILPPSRPITEPTPISYMIYKCKLTEELCNILQVTSKVGAPASYDEILRFDAKLREVKKAMPPHLRIQPLQTPIDLALVMSRINVDILYLKEMCILHRKYVTRMSHNPRYAHSRRAAIEASLETLSHLDSLYRETQPGRQLEQLRWFMVSIATKDFLMPAFLVMLDLHNENEIAEAAQKRGSHAAGFWTKRQRLEMIRRLEVTRDIWQGFTEHSMEAAKGYNILKLMLEKVVRPSASSENSSPASTSDMPLVNMDMFATTAQLPMPMPNQSQLEQSAAMTLGMMSEGVMSPNTAAAYEALQHPSVSAYPDLETPVAGTAVSAGLTSSFGFSPGAGEPAAAQSPFSFLFNNMDSMEFGPELDWNTLQNYTENSNWGTDQSFQYVGGPTGDPNKQQGPPPANGSSRSYF